MAVRPGDLVAPNQPIVRVLLTGDLWIKASFRRRTWAKCG